MIRKLLVVAAVAATAVLTVQPAAWADDSTIPSYSVNDAPTADAADEAAIAADLADAGVDLDTVQPASDTEADAAVAEVVASDAVAVDDSAVADPFTLSDAQDAAVAKVAALGL